MKTISAKEFDKKFDNGEDIDDYVDWASAEVKAPLKTKRVNIDFPLWLLNSIDEEANRISVPRQSIVKLWLSEKIDTIHKTT